MQDDRLNSPSTSAISFDVMGQNLLFSQDPNSKHLGTTLWDASMVFVKFLERNCRKGQFSAEKLKGKRVVELGAGCGLSGFGMAILGCDVISTDQVEVLPLLTRNIERNASRITQGDAENPCSVSFGSIEVVQLDWGNQDHIRVLHPPFDYIIGTDIVYAEHLLEPLFMTILSLSGPRTTIMLGNELRSTTLHEKMMTIWKSIFEVKQVPRKKMDSKYQHANIQLFVMKQKCQMEYVGNAYHTLILQGGGPDSVNNKKVEVLDDESSNEEECANDNMGTGGGEALASSKPLDGWEVRRSGASAAALLKNIMIE